MSTEDSPRRSVPNQVDVAVVGAGIGGLTTALELARNGFRVCVFEKNRHAGGYATGFRLQGFHFDVSHHLIGGLAPGQTAQQILASIGVYDKLKFKRRDTLCESTFPDFDFVLPNGREALTAALVGRFPKEAKAIVALMNFIEALKKDVIASSMTPTYEGVQANRPSIEYGQKTFGDLLCAYVSDPALMAILGQMWMFIGLPPRLASANYAACMFCSTYLEGTYSIVGGGEALVRAMVEQLRELGSDCLVQSEVTSILLHGSAAKGVELADGAKVTARAVVSGISPYGTFESLIPKEGISDLFRFRIQQMEPSISMYALYLGLDCPPQELGIPTGHFHQNHTMDFEAAYQHAVQGEIEKTNWYATSYGDAISPMYPTGGGICCIGEVTPTSNWLDLSPTTYQEQKKAIRDRLFKKYTTRFPGLEKHIVVEDFATPRTMYRYTQSRGGAVYGFAQTVEQSGTRRLRSRSPIEGLFLSGAWTWSGGGYEGTMMSGIQAATTVLAELGPRIADAHTQRAASGPSNIYPPKESSTPPLMTTESSASAAGLAIEDAQKVFPHTLPIRVYGDDLNSRGHTDASSYLRYMDRGRVEAIEALCRDVNAESWLKEFIVNVYKIDIDCATVVGLGHMLEVQTRLERTSSHRAAFLQRIRDLNSGTWLVNGAVEVLFLNQERKLVPVPPIISGTIDMDPVAKKERRKLLPLTDQYHFPFRTTFRVYYEDTDCQGITYHISHVRFCERALFDVVQTVWPEMSATRWMSKHKVGVARVGVRYLNASTLGDHLEVRTGVLAVSEYRLTFGQRITSLEAQKVVADVTTEVEFRNEQEIVVPIPAQVLDAVLPALPNAGI